MDNSILCAQLANVSTMCSIVILKAKVNQDVKMVVEYMHGLWFLHYLAHAVGCRGRSADVFGSPPP